MSRKYSCVCIIYNKNNTLQNIIHIVDIITNIIIIIDDIFSLTHYYANNINYYDAIMIIQILSKKFTSSVN